MKRKREYLDYLNDILEGAQKAVGFAGDLSFENFVRDEKSLFAVVRALEIIGEAAGRIPKSVRDRSPDVPWQDMIGMRNIVIHEYFGVDAEVIWRTVKDDLPKLQAAIEKLLVDQRSEKD